MAALINGTHVISGTEDDGYYVVYAGRKGREYQVMPVIPPSAEQIRDLRQNAGLTTDEFSEILGVSESTIAAWENGLKSPEGATCRLLNMMQRDRELIEKYICA